MSINPSDLINHIMTTPQTGQLVRVVNESGAEFYIPVSYFQTAASGVDGVTGTGNISVDNTDPQNPIVSISAAPTFTTSVTTATFATSTAATKVSINANTFTAGGTDATVDLLYLSKSTGSHVFYTNSVARWSINGSGALNPNADNTYDIGNLLVNPRDIHATRAYPRRYVPHT